jgi:hypothetical protein
VFELVSSDLEVAPVHKDPALTKQPKQDSDPITP